MQRRLLIPLAAVFSLCANASFAGFFDNFYRVLDLAATPSGAPILTTGDGTRINGLRSGRVRILPDQLGNGYSLEFDRNFGVDSQGRPETFDLGPLDMTLSGSTQMTAGFTRRGFLIGNLDVSANNLNYQIRARSGAQNTTLSGTMNVANQIEINQFGFYSMQLSVSNTNSQLTVDGVVSDLEEIDQNFDVGPIFIEGNIFVDMLAGVIAGAGGDTSLLAELFPRSAIPDLATSLQEAFLKDDVVAGLLLNDAEFSLSSDANTVAAFGIPEGIILENAFRVGNGVGGPGPSLIPEPTTAFGLLMIGAAAWTRRR
ncbi:MAG: PEP-CTERM sorting domain-containing protein [Phycisphaerae bacterium]